MYQRGIPRAHPHSISRPSSRCGHGPSVRSFRGFDCKHNTRAYCYRESLYLTSDDSTEKPEQQPLAKKYPELEILSANLENAQPVSRSHLERYLTPREEHYIRNRHRTPVIDEIDWTVSLTGWC